MNSVLITIRPVLVICAAAIGILTLSGCAVGPNYRQPKTEVTAEYRFASASTNSFVDLPWWNLFADTNDRLICYDDFSL